jgi:hypothetical protein
MEIISAVNYPNDRQGGQSVLYVFVVPRSSILRPCFNIQVSVLQGMNILPDPVPGIDQLSDYLQN